MSEVERRFIQEELRAEGNTISGYAAVFHRKADPGTQYQLSKGIVERIHPDAFNRALQEQHDVRALYNHDPNYLLGRTTANTLRLSVNSKGLKYEIPFDAHDPDHVRVRTKIERKDLTGSSFAFRVKKDEWSEERGVEVRTVLDVDLIDVGPVVYPAYTSTTSGLRSDDHLDEAMASRQRWLDKIETEKRLATLDKL